VDAATRLAVVRVSGPAPAVTPTPWTPRRAQHPRYLLSTDLTSEGVSLRPSYVGSLAPTNAAAWRGMVWALPSGTDLVPGSFLFTTTGEFVGLAIPSNGGVAIVPGAAVLAEADRLLTSPPAPAGTIAIEVQALTEPIAAVTRSRAGVVVTSVARGGPAEGALMVGDVIEGVDGADLVTREQWNARTSRLAAGETLALRVRRRGEVRETSIEAMPLAADIVPSALGLTLRRRAGIGTEVTGVQRLSAADRAGLIVGDVITLFGALQAPTPAQVTRSFAALPSGDRVLVAVSRGDAHFVTVVGR
jgi:S1-C subfamily serine protease